MRIPIIVLTLGLFMLSSCVPVAQTPPSLPTATDAPTFTPTIVWFPPTRTLTPMPPVVATATLAQQSGLEDVLFRDDFSQPELWNLRVSDAARVQVNQNRLVLAIQQPDLYLISLRSEPLLSDFYAEITAYTNLCVSTDEYGLLVRAKSQLDYYRLVLNCAGQLRLERVTNGRILKIQPDLYSGHVPPGAPGQVRIGFWASGMEMRVFLNGQHQFTVFDPVHFSGTLGVFARSNNETAVTVGFSDLIVQSVNYVSPTPTQTPSLTPTPTRTRQP